MPRSGWTCAAVARASVRARGAMSRGPLGWSGRRRQRERWGSTRAARSAACCRSACGPRPRPDGHGRAPESTAPAGESTGNDRWLCGSVRRMLASTYASPASLLLRLGECRSRYRETASGLIATTGTPAARNAAGSNPFRGLNRDRHRFTAQTLLLSQHVHQLREPGHGVIDAQPHPLRPALLDDADVVMVLGPVDPTPQLHGRPLP